MADTEMSASRSTGIDPAIFEHLQAKIDEEGTIRDELKEIVQALEKQDRITQSILSKVHSTPTSRLESEVVNPATESMVAQNISIRKLSEAASMHPFYKYNGSWTREVQNLIFHKLYTVWLQTQDLMTLDQVGEDFGVPVNLKDRDAFHITIEEYLLALTNLLEELARLAVNSVTLGDFSRPLQISKFIKDVHAGFQLLNLKNDALRRRSDSIKYNVKKVEDVVYDLSLRGLVPKD